MSKTDTTNDVANREPSYHIDEQGRAHVDLVGAGQLTIERAVIEDIARRSREQAEQATHESESRSDPEP